MNRYYNNIIISILSVSILLTSYSKLVLAGDTNLAQANPTGISHVYSTTYNDDMVENQNMPVLPQFTTQITTMMMAQTGIIGTFFDAQAHQKGMMLLQSLRAQSHHKYQPSRQLCSFATGAKSLAASEEKGKINAYMLNDEVVARETASSIHLGSNIGDTDHWAEARSFISRNCSVHDNLQNGLAGMCGNGPTNKDRLNLDINFTKLVDTKSTLNIDFTDNILTDDEKDIIVMSHMLYSNKIFPKLKRDELRSYNSGFAYMDHRRAITKSEIARNSFVSIAGMKSSGNGSNATYLKEILKTISSNKDSTDLMADIEINKLISNNPSYYEQMEVLTKKIYQNPNFYIGLIDKPDNINRQKASMEAFGLMQDRDIYESLMRREMLLSQIIEVQLEREFLNREE